MAYQPIENYGIIGNLRTAALVGADGSIDWLCMPNFDSPSVFAAILDDRKGGRYVIAPTCDEIRNKQFYWPETNVLVTRFMDGDAVGEVDLFMPGGPDAEKDPHQLIRRVRVMRGKMPFRLICHPAFDYARASHRTTITSRGARFESDKLSLGLASSIPLRADGRGAYADFELEEGASAVFVLRIIDPQQGAHQCPGTAAAEDLFRRSTPRPCRTRPGSTPGARSTGSPITGSVKTRASGRSGAGGGNSSSRGS
jgi:GH15 family glucan-1,4-alpha-glucosidase